MKKITLTAIASIVLVISFIMSGCSTRVQDKRVVIYSSSSPLRNTAIMEMLQEQFPDYSIEILYLATGAHGARLMAEGENTDADIVVGLEDTQLQQVRSVLGDMSSYDVSCFMPDLLDTYNQFLPWERTTFGVAINEDMLNNLGVPIPTSYEDLLDPVYKGLIMMPNPKVSSTGYIYLAYMIERMGEDEAFAYFDKLAKNIHTFTSSGSGVATSLANGDIGIGFVSLHNAVTVMEAGANLTITFFDEYAPSSMGGVSMTKKGMKNNVAVEVFNYLVYEVSRMDKKLYSPVQVFVDLVSDLEHYLPENMPYKPMNLDIETLGRIQDRWNY